MQGLLRTASLAVALASLAGCYTGSTYVRPHTVIHSDRQSLMDSVTAVVTARGMRVLHVDAESGRVTALSPIDRSGGVATRERWWFYVNDDDVHVEMHPEMRSDAPGRPRWERTEFVCECYRYAREREVLAAIGAQVRATRATVERGTWLAGLDARMRPQE
jgi:hypothetical protein